VAVPSHWEPITIPDWAWQKPETRAALEARNAGALLRLAQSHGASQGRIAAAIGIAQGRVSELIHGQRDVADLVVWHRIAEGLHMPDDARITLGIAPARSDDLGHMSGEITRVWASQAPMADEIRRRALEAREIDVMAVRALGIMALNDSLLRQAMTSGRRLQVRVLLLDPECPSARRRADEIGESLEAFAAGIQLSLTRLRECAAENPGLDLRVWLYQRLPVWRFIRMDSVAYVSAFDAAWEGHESAIYEVPRTDRGAFWAGYARLFQDTLESGQLVIGAGE
jgi:hypothetical protein